jgi:RNA polymerase sigma-70 factor (ECF subfamily)
MTDVTESRHYGVMIFVSDDQELMRRVPAGDVAAFEELADRYHAICLRFAWRQLGQREDAEEAVQDALVRAFRALRRGRLPQRFRPWLMRIVVNRCRSTMARRARRRRLLRLWASRNHREPAPPPSLDDEVDPELLAALAALTPALREAFLLRHIEELGYEEMSAITGAGVSALKMRVKRACDQLLEMLEKRNG